MARGRTIFLDCNDQLRPVFDEVSRGHEPPIALNSRPFVSEDRFRSACRNGRRCKSLVRVPKDVKMVDIGGDHRYVEGWAYGLADVWPAQIEGQIRVDNPGASPRRR